MMKVKSRVKEKLQHDCGKLKRQSMWKAEEEVAGLLSAYHTVVARFGTRSLSTDLEVVDDLYVWKKGNQFEGISLSSFPAILQ